MNTVKNANTAYREILHNILEKGIDIQAKKTLSTGSEKVTKDLWNYSIIIKNPTDRIVKSDLNKFNVAGAVSRFIWMMGANNRIKDIEFYWGKGVGNFSDDEIIMPGSNYGARMITPRPGMNQIESVINRLKDDPSTRRGAISIYHPEDAVRDSKDIPCAFGIFYTIRENKLNTTIIMRSNNASYLFPYNIFEFSLLSEVVANEVGVDLGELHFQAVSMHLYEANFEKALGVIKETQFKEYSFSNPIPKNNNSLEKIKKLIKLEADLRHASMGITIENVNSWIDLGKSELDSYWVQFYLIILHYIAEKKLFDNELTSVIYSELDNNWKALIEKPIIERKETKNTQTLFDDSKSRVVKLDNQFANQLKIFDESCIKLNENLISDDKKEISLKEYVELKEKLINQEAVAARDGQIVSVSQISNALNDIRK
ncbi:thymidylate synthase [Flavobacterium sp.]